MTNPDFLQGQAVDANTLVDVYDAIHQGLRRTGAKAETFSRAGSTVSAVTLATGTTLFSVIILPAFTKVTNIVFVTNTTAAGTPTHGFVALYSSARALLAQSADTLTTAWAASSEITTALAAPYTTGANDALYYLAVSVSASSTPTFTGVAGQAALNALAPQPAFSDTTAVTGTASASGTVSAGSSLLYAYVS